MHLVVGIVCAICVLLMWAFENRTLARQAWNYKKSLKKE